MVVVRFEVGRARRRQSSAKSKLLANVDLIPAGATQPLVKLRSIDDVPILALSLSSPAYDHFTLRRMTAQITDEIKQVPDVSEVRIIGGQRRQIRVLLDDAKMSSRAWRPVQLFQCSAVESAAAVSSLSAQNREVVVETGDFLES
jgi:multidrug efflux pump subunit AcrB